LSPHRAKNAPDASAWCRYLWLAGLILIGFGLRFSFLIGRVYHIDEFISLLAAVQVARSGWPILPSGLFYDHGLLVSYLSGGLFAVLGFDELVGRWPLLWAGTLTIPAAYAVGRRLFRSTLTAGMAALLVTFDVNAILWSGRVRMYALAQLCVLLCLYWMAEGLLLRPRPTARYWLLFFVSMALLSHYVSLLVLPAALIGLFVASWLFRRSGARMEGELSWHWLELVAAGLLLALAVGLLAIGQITTTTAIQSTGESGGLLADFLNPGLEWSRFDDFVYFFVEPPYQVLLPLIAFAGLGVAWRAVRHGLDRRDVLWLWLALSLVLTVFGMGAVLTHTWRKTRYLFILCVPAFWLLAAEGVRRLGDGLAAGLGAVLRRATFPAASQPGAASVVLGQHPSLSAGARLGAILVCLAGIAWYWLPEDLTTARARGTGNYDTAFGYVRQQWQPGDRVMTVHPSASYLYLGRSDFYANQVTARVLKSEDDEAETVDRYVGGRLISSEEELNQLLSQPGRLWFVTDDDRLFSRCRPFFVQQVLAQMRLVYRSGGVLVFLSRPYPRPLPAEPGVAVSARFGDLIELGGYHLDLDARAPDGSVQLVLYWRLQAAGFPRPYKVFVQFRNEQDQMIAQADHYVLEGLLTQSVLKRLRDQGEWLRDAAHLTLPPSLAPGHYRLLVGLYDPDTFERLPLLGDQSGENAVLLRTVDVP